MAVDQQQAPQDRAPQPSRGDSQPQPDYPAPYGQPQPYAPAPYPGQPYPQQPLPQQPMPQEPPRHHVHHSYIWLGSIQAGAAMFFVVLVSGFSGFVGALADGETIGDDLPLLMLVIGAIVLGLVLIIGLVALFQWLSYKHLYYIIGPEEFNLYSGIFNKKRVHVPYQRIQSVDQRASLLQRVFGVCTVSIDTAGGSNNKAVQVPYVQKSQAEQLRTELFARKQYATAVQEGMAPQEAAVAVAAASGVVLPQAGAAGQAAVAGAAGQAPHNVLDAPAEIWTDVRGVFGGSAVDTGKVTYEYGLTNKELLFTGLSNNTAFVLVILGILGGAAQFASQMAPVLTGMVDPLVGQFMLLSGQLFGGNLVAAGVALVLVIAAVMWLLSIVGSAISFGGFRACRRDNRIEVERGLLQHQFQGVSVDRVQSVIVKQSFIRRLLGYCELSLGKIDAAAESSDEQQKSLSQGLVVHPFVKMSRVPEILAGLVPEFAGVPVESTPVAPVALRRALIRRGIIQGTGLWLAVIIVIGQLCSNAFIVPDGDGVIALFYINTGAFIGYALCLVLFVLDLVGAVLWFRGSGFAYNEHFMQVSNGGFARETVSFPRKKIQFGYTKTNPFQRRARTATVSARTAAGIGGTTIRLIDVCEEDARSWLDWLKPRGNVVE
ncbi:PH domain-containing protein [Gordonibacter pamelaeae]|uniref:PH domain-containing protein n=1 Tax=Gordonibacter pamelaeae TaxID=471189 RepID=UPI00210F18E0|nr:PH domain-containing protein [Gordonibacter pamelaeae]MCQ4845981.1 PH domain-containing protein [Gordonibacter pamelaeae]MCQ4848820.1 PH domain-containing protein [Gordonibacter pamelaeae]